jgi:hypothetical protein
MPEEPRGALQPEAQSGKGAGGNGNGTGNGSQHDRDLLDQLNLTAFSADPPGVPECSNATSTLSWNVVGTPETTHVQFQLLEYWMSGGPPSEPSAQYNIGATGSLSVTINSPTNFNLVASLPSASEELGRVTIGTGGNPNCSDFTWSKDTVQTLVETTLVEQFETEAAKQDLRVRIVNGDSHTYSLDSNGFHIVDFLTIPGHKLPPYFIDVNLDVTMVVAPVVFNCGLSLAYSDFSADADYPAEVNLLFPGLVTSVENVISYLIEGDMKPKFINSLGAAFTFPQGGLVHLNINSDQSITFTVCPPVP